MSYAPWEQYIIYLRKSRQDDPRETVEEVLAKHERILQEYALREFGHKIPEGNIYREVVSGESIDAREEVLKVLARIEDPSIKGVLVVEPSRLSRGDLLDCGRLINDLRYSKTLVVTPVMTYDLSNKMERKFFQDELLRGNDFLEYVKEILMRGRLAAVGRGCFIGRFAPYGYKKIKIGKDCTLEIVPDQAEIVKLIFELFVNEGMSHPEIARRLDDMGLKTVSGNLWARSTVRQIISNPHYNGKVVFGRTKRVTVMEHGERVVRLVTQKEGEYLMAEGLHEAIIPDELWDAAQKKVASHPRHTKPTELRNPLAGVLRCAGCGCSLTLNYYPNASDRYECRRFERGGKKIARCYKSARAEDVMSDVLFALEHSELPALKLRVTNDEGNARKIQQNQLAKLESQLEEYADQEENLFELVENKTYTPELFAKRHKALLEKVKACKDEIAQVRANMPKPVNYQERAAMLEHTIEVLKDDTATAEQKNKSLKNIVEKIEYTGMPTGTPQGVENVFSLQVFLRL